jgi:hypothetical protein
MTSTSRSFVQVQGHGPPAHERRCVWTAKRCLVAGLCRIKSGRRTVIAG